MLAQGKVARRWARGIAWGLIYAASLQWSPSGRADVPRSSGEYRVVYRCVRDGVPMFTDVPCDGERLKIDLNRNLSVAPPVAVRSAKPAPRPLRDSPATARQRAAQQARCDRLQAQLVVLRSKLRLGYDAKTGIRLEERRRQLREQARAAKCPRA